MVQGPPLGGTFQAYSSAPTSERKAMNYANVLGGPQPAMGVPANQAQPAGQRPQAVQPMAGQPPAVNPMALLAMGQQQMGRAMGGNPFDTQAMAQVIAQGLMGAQPPLGYARTPGFNPGALG